MDLHSHEVPQQTDTRRCFNSLSQQEVPMETNCSNKSPTIPLTQINYDKQATDLPQHGIRYRRIPSQNVVLRIRNRETYGLRHNVSHYHLSRQFYQNVFPNYTIVNIEKPPCFLRKFTPDGRYLIAFSQDQTSIEIYEYQGPSNAEQLLKDLPDKDYTEEDIDEDRLQDIRSKLFDVLFKKKHVVNVATHGEQLNRECSLFTDDSRFIIVGSAAFVNEESHPSTYY